MHHPIPIMPPGITIKVSIYNLSKEQLIEYFYNSVVTNKTRTIDFILNSERLKNLNKTIDINYGKGIFLEAACKNGNLEIVKLLTNEPAFDKSLDYSKAVKNSVKSGNQKLVKYLLTELKLPIDEKTQKYIKMAPLERWVVDTYHFIVNTPGR